MAFNLGVIGADMRVAEWLGRALQKLVQRFESARDLQKKRITHLVILFY